MHVAPSQTIQSYIDEASPGDLIIVDPTCTTTARVATACTTPSTTNIHNPATHSEMVIMWKPVRLQGAGAASSIIDANAQPGRQAARPLAPACRLLVRLGAERRTVHGSGGTNIYDPSGNFSCPDNVRRSGTTLPLSPIVRRLTGCRSRPRSVGTLT